MQRRRSILSYELSITRLLWQDNCDAFYETLITPCLFWQNTLGIKEKQRTFKILINLLVGISDLSFINTKCFSL